MLRRILIPAMAVAAVTSAVWLVSASAAPSGSFTLVASLDRHSLVRVDARPKGTTAGDVIVFSTSLRRDGKPDGRAEFVQTVVDPRYRGVSMRADLLLADGTLELQGAGLGRRAPGGARPSSETDMAVVGGTGAYAGARGTLTSAGGARRGLTLTIRLR